VDASRRALAADEEWLQGRLDRLQAARDMLSAAIAGL